MSPRCGNVSHVLFYNVGPFTKLFWVLVLFSLSLWGSGVCRSHFPPRVAMRLRSISLEAIFYFHCPIRHLMPVAWSLFVFAKPFLLALAFSANRSDCRTNATFLSQALYIWDFSSRCQLALNFQRLNIFSKIWGRMLKISQWDFCWRIRVYKGNTYTCV